MKSVCENGLTGNCDSDYSEVTFTVDDNGQPVHSDAQVEIRPRIFLEGNFFLDVQPGQPERPRSLERRHHPDHPDLDRGPARPDPDHAPGARPGQPAEAARGLRHGAQLTSRRAADDATQDPEVQGLTAARGDQQVLHLRRRPAARDSAIVNEALQGTDPHDLSNLIAAQAKVFGALSRPRVPAPGPDHQLQHRHRRARRRVGQPRSARSSLLGPTLAIAEPSLRHTNATLPLPARLRARPGEGHPGAAGDDRRLAALARARPTALLGKDELGYIANQLRLDRPGRRQVGGRRPRPLPPDRPAQRLRRQRAAADRRRRAERLRPRLQLRHRRAELQGVRLRDRPVSRARAAPSTATDPRCASSRPAARPRRAARSRTCARRCRVRSAPAATRSGAARTTPPIGTRPGARQPSLRSAPTSPARATRSPT